MCTCIYVCIKNKPAHLFLVTLYKTLNYKENITVFFVIMILRYYGLVLRILVVTAIYEKMELMTDKKLSKAVLY